MKKEIFISESISVKDALKRLNKTAKKILLVIDKNNRLLGTLTDGDIRRFILKGKKLENGIKEAYNKKPFCFKKGDYSRDEIKKMLIENKLELVPIVDRGNKVIDFITLDEVFSDTEKPDLNSGLINVPVVIMAGGRSTRLEPITKILPKPLIPVGDKPILELIIDSFRKKGAKKYYLVLNYKSEMIESYFNNIEKDYQLKCIKETNYLGTAGGLKLLERELDDTFIVSNCDVLINTNYEEVLDSHIKKNAKMTILSSIQHFMIPYGVVKFRKGGVVVDITEKPEYTFTINAGVYILNKEVLQHIPKKTPLDMDNLIEGLIKNNEKIITYPVNENDYIDIGQLDEYKKTIEKLQFS